MRDSYSVEISDVFKNVLDELSWQYFFDETTGVIYFPCPLNGKLKHINFEVHIKNNCIICYAISPIGGDANNKEMMWELQAFFNSMNPHILNGNFLFDNDSGEIRYKSFVNCNGQMPSDEIIRDSIFIAADMFGLMSSFFLDIIFLNCSATDEVDMATTMIDLHNDLENIVEFDQPENQGDDQEEKHDNDQDNNQEAYLDEKQGSDQHDEEEDESQRNEKKEQEIDKWTHSLIHFIKKFIKSY